MAKSSSQGNHNGGYYRFFFESTLYLKTIETLRKHLINSKQELGV